MPVASEVAGLRALSRVNGMNVQMKPSDANGLVAATGGDIALRLTVERHADASSIETEWRLLEATGVGTVFQRYDWVEAYVRNVAPHEGLDPAYLLGRLDGRPAFVLPLGVKKHGPVRLAHWLGGSHSGYNFGLWSRECAALMPRLGRTRLRRKLREALGGVDGMLLRRIPNEHDGTRSPLAALASIPSSVMGYSVSLEGGIDEVITRTKGGSRRRRARTKEKRMGELGAVAHGIIADPARTHEALEFFAEHKALRLAEQGLPNVFAEPGVMDFLHELADRSTGMREPLLQVTQLEVGGKARAVIGSGVHAGRVNLYILTYAHDETLPHSPGQVLMYRHIEESCQAGRRVFDFGVGYELYKESWADARHHLSDGYVAFTAAGQVAVGSVRLWDASKSLLRRNAKLWNGLKELRAQRGAAAKEQDGNAD